LSRLFGACCRRLLGGGVVVGGFRHRRFIRHLHLLRLRVVLRRRVSLWLLFSI
jgi:hypothetical protein